MRDLKRHHPLNVKDILDTKQWQKTQDNFSTVTGVCLRIVDSQGKPVTSPSNEPRLCNELTKVPSILHKICGKCLPTFLGGKALVDKNLSYTCLPGVHNFIAPLKISNRDETIGYLIVGPVILVMRKPKEEYRKVAEELGIDLEYLWNAIQEIKIVSFRGAQSLVELIKDVAEYTLRFAYQNLMRERELTMAQDITKLSKLLDALLDVAFQISGADIGSIMFFDKGSGELTIKTSKGIPDEIVRSTKVKLGERISGMAAEEGRSILINDSDGNNRIKPYLNRPNLSSAMILPLKANKRVFGVMNLAALATSSARFNQDCLNLMDKLADLASVAISQM